MYFPNEQESKYVTRGLIRSAREQGVAEELRGWNWVSPPVEPLYDLGLGVFEVSGGYCPTSRDLYLRRVVGEEIEPTAPMIAGSAYHNALMQVVTEFKRSCYQYGTNYIRLMHRLADVADEIQPDKLLANNLPDHEAKTIRGRLEQLITFQSNRLIARIEEALIKQPYLREDALVASALPVVMEQKLDGRFIGLSRHLSVDAFTSAEQIVVDLKFGKPRDFHRLYTTGYALVIEALYEYPVNVGAVIYGSFHRGRLTVRRDYHLIDDELRQWFIEQRDDRSLMIHREQDPGVASQCSEMCAFYSLCNSGNP